MKLCNCKQRHAVWFAVIMWLLEQLYYDFQLLCSSYQREPALCFVVFGLELNLVFSFIIQIDVIIHGFSFPGWFPRLVYAVWEDLLLQESRDVFYSCRLLAVVFRYMLTVKSRFWQSPVTDIASSAQSVSCLSQKRAKSQHFTRDVSFRLNCYRWWLRGPRSPYQWRIPVDNSQFDSIEGEDSHRKTISTGILHPGKYSQLTPQLSVALSRAEKTDILSVESEWPIK